MSPYYGDDVHVARGNLQTPGTTAGVDGEGREGPGSGGTHPVDTPLICIPTLSSPVLPG